MGACALSFAVTACASFQEGIDDAKKSKEALKTELGMDANVSFHTFSGTGGKKTIVTVAIRPAPTGDVATVKAQVTTVVTRSFRSPVERVDVTF